MAREKMVTRTVNYEDVKCLVALIKDGKLEEKSYRVSAQEGDNIKVQKYLAKRYDTESEKIVTVLSREAHEVLYAMTEEDFIKYAKIVPTRFANLKKLDE